ncbi:hypothetical protein BH20ACT24_BH20ACT24_04370 [soil metagenome]
MTRLAAVLETIYESRCRYRTVRATGRAHGSDWRLWWAGPHHIRTEEAYRGGTLVTVQAGAQWWMRQPNGKVETNKGDETLHVGFDSSILQILQSRPLLSTAILEVLDDDVIAGRPAATLRARPRQESEHARWWSSTEPFDVAIDLQRGIVLRGPQLDVTEVAFDEDFGDGVFGPLARRGEPVRDVTVRPREVSLEEARATMPFPILLPTVLPDGARLTRCLISPEIPPVWVGLSWVIDPGIRYFLHLRQGPDVESAPASPDWREVSQGEVTVRVREARGAGFRSVSAVIDRNGTLAQIDSDLPAETVIEVAVSLGAGE